MCFPGSLLVLQRAAAALSDEMPAAAAVTPVVHACCPPVPATAALAEKRFLTGQLVDGIQQRTACAHSNVVQLVRCAMPLTRAMTADWMCWKQPSGTGAVPVHQLVQ